MHKNFYTRTLHGLIVTPLLVANLSLGIVPQTASTTESLLTKIQQNMSEDAAVAQEINILKDRADKIDAYFRDRDMPLEGFGMKMAEVAEKNNLDWRLIPAIAVRESTGGKFACKSKPNNPFGWGSCKIGFKTMDQAIETLGHNLGGNNPRTKNYYANKSVKGILETYNPPSVVPTYAKEVMTIMDRIGDK